MLFLSCLIEEKNKNLAWSMKTITNSMDCSRSRIILFLIVIGRFSPECTLIGYRKNLRKSTKFKEANK
jgi:hypothetical protein